MNITVNTLLAESRTRLSIQVQVLKEARAGFSEPTDETRPELRKPIAPNAHESSLPSHVDTVLSYNVSPAHEEMNRYIVDLVRGLQAQYDCTADDALDLVWEVAEDLAEAGELPEMPDEPDAPDNVVAWLAAARALGFGAKVQEGAEEELEDDEAGEGEGDLTQPEIQTSQGF